MRRKSIARRTCGALAVLCVLGTAVSAQESPAGLSTRLDLSQRLEFTDNAEFEVDGASDFFALTSLGFNLESVRSIDRFVLNLDTEIEEGRRDQSSLNFGDSGLQLAYDRDTRNAGLNANFQYRESDVDFEFFQDDFDAVGVLVEDSGTRKSVNFGLGLEVGREAPVGASLNWDFSDITFSGTSDPDLTDRTNSSISGQIDFRFSPRVTASLTGRYADFDAQGNGTNRETVGFGISTQLEINSVLSANASLGYDRIERSGDETGTDEGVNVGFGFSRALSNGSLGLQFSSDVNSNEEGRRSSLTVTREVELPRGELLYSVGLTGAGAVGTDPLFQVDYQHELSAATLSVGLAQRVNTDANNNEQINTTFQLGYSQEINSVSDFGVDLSIFNRNELSAGANDEQRIDLSLSYRRDLTGDWGFVSGFSHTLVSEDSEADRRRNTVFVGLDRSFSWSP